MSYDLKDESPEISIEDLARFAETLEDPAPAAAEHVDGVPLWDEPAFRFLREIEAKMETAPIAPGEAQAFVLSLLITSLSEGIDSLDKARAGATGPALENAKLVAATAGIFIKGMRRDIDGIAEARRRVQVIKDVRLRDRIARKAGLLS